MSLNARLSSAQKKLVESNMPLAHFAAREACKRAGKRAIYGEMLSGAAVGLMDAATDWKKDKSKFTTFAPQRVKGGVANEIRQDNHWFSNRGWRKPTVFRRDGLTSAAMDTHADHRASDTDPRFAAPTKENEEIQRRLSTPSPLASLSSRDAVQSILATLPDDLAYVLRRYYIDGMNLKEIARECGCSQSGVCKDLKYAIGMSRQTRVFQELQAALTSARKTHAVVELKGLKP